MPAQQQVVAPPSRSGMFLVLTVNEGSEEAVLAFLANVSSLTRAVGFRVPTDDLNCIVGIGALLWDRLFTLPRPKHLHEFEAIVGPRHTAPSTPGDILVHLRSGHPDVCFELARQIGIALAGHAVVVDEIHGFKYFDERDLLGFVDGTENPEGVTAEQAVLIGAEDPAYAGGSYVIVQKYLHDLSAWNSITVEEQESVIGRSKLDDIQKDVLPANSHVALNTIIDPDGVQRQIVRDNMPFGRIGDAEFGTYFIGYAGDPAVTELMLHRMFLGDPPGNTDRILDFSTAHTGGLFFVPTRDFLDNAPGSPPSPPTVTAAQIAAVTREDAADPAAPATGPGSGSGSGDLAIGSLRQTTT